MNFTGVIVMGKCSIDHTLKDVMNKLNSQETYLPNQLMSEIQVFLKGELSQETLNDLFHLLKKYDLAPKNEQENRNEKLTVLIGLKA